MIRSRIIGSASDGQINTLIRRLSELPGFIPEALAAAVPTVQVLLSHASTSAAVDPKANPYAARSYKVDAETQERIDGNTLVGVDGNAIRVGTSESGSAHDRPLVPIGSLPLKWRGAISQKINGGVRRKLRFDQATAFLQQQLGAGPVSAYGFNRVARQAGVKAQALREAKASLGVKVTGRGKKVTLSL